MKTKHFIILSILLLSSCSMNLFAQEHIEALFKKCESMESISMTVIRNRDKDTKKVYKTITNITIKSNPALVNEFLTAFKKDELNALKIIDTRKNGKMIPQFYRFEKVSYSFSLDKGEGNASISAIENQGEAYDS